MKHITKITINTLLLLISIPSFGAYDSTDCGGAIAELDFIERKQAVFREDKVESIVSVTKNDRAVQFRVWSGIDAVGLTCVKDSQGIEKVVFRATCGGSGCSDLSNIGIINPSNLLIELTPSKKSRVDAERILGKKIPDIKMYYVSHACSDLKIKNSLCS